MHLARTLIVLVLVGAVTSHLECGFDDKLLVRQGRQGRSLYKKLFNLATDTRYSHLGITRSKLELVIWGEGSFESLTVEAIKEVWRDINKNLRKCLDVSMVLTDYSRLAQYNQSNPNYVFVEIRGDCYRGVTSGIVYDDRTMIMGNTLCNDRYGNTIVGWNDWRSAFLHELFHVMGVGHTQSRSDRDTYITVNYENILDYAVPSYDKCENCGFYGTYECNSVMHYGQTAGAKLIDGVPQETMTAKDKRTCFFNDDFTRSGSATKNDWNAVRQQLDHCEPIPTARRGRSSRGSPWSRRGQWRRWG